MLSEMPDAVGTKFHAGGTVRPFAGLSIVAELSSELPQYQLLADLQERARSASFGAKLRMLPEASFHMTVFDLLCDEVRRAESWSSELSLHAPLDQVDLWMETRIAALSSWPESSRMRFAEIGPLDVSLHVLLDPADADTASTLAEFRETVSRKTSIRHANHDRYRFHVSLAYRIAAFDERESADFEVFCLENNQVLASCFGTLKVPRPELVYFDDMCSFPTARGG